MTATLNPEHPVLLVDDEQQALISLTQNLLAAGITNTLTCTDSRDVLPLFAEREIELVLLDVTMPNITGEELLEQLARDYPDVPVIMITGIQEIGTAVHCLKTGAFDYLTKPVERGRLMASVGHALEQQRLKRENCLLKQRIFPGGLEHTEAFSNIVTNNQTMHAMFQYCEAIAPSGLPVLITGETGVGKELLARAVHTLSELQGKFVPVNIAGLDDNVFSDTLFGHRKGAFTGADETRQGLIVRAAGGTLFLDEIGDLNQQSQVKLLRLLQEHEYCPLGSDVPKEANVRIVAATNRDIDSLQDTSSEFRRDLFYRLCSHHMHIPPLRERIDDLPLLCEHFCEEASRSLSRPLPGSPDELVTALAGYGFPGNVRELQAIVSNAVSSGSFKNPATLTGASAKALTAGIRPAGRFDSTSDSVLFTGNLPTLEHTYELLVAEALRRCGGNQTRAAKMIGISRQTMIRYLKKNT
ncbi:MAG: sigma-54-dependent Fis family transcriptional regulator [Deltaproteobacteria bacterium]|nr:sigma-54-dependent Fis family transcriptional regulator [Deltaproteobacteria bacterium]